MSESLYIGQALNDRYVIRAKIGEGGGGIVYRAFDSHLQGDVVVKQIKDGNSSYLSSRTEVDILKNLKHERLPKVLDFFDYNGTIYTVMDFISGERYESSTLILFELNTGTFT